MAATRAAVLGSPVAHSLSPVLHTAGYRELGLTDWSYQAIECDEAGLPELLGSLDPSYAGLSLTMPLKRAVLPLLDRTEPLAAEVGAANTVLLAGDEPDGRARAGGRQRAGYNTDVPGMVATLVAAGLPADGTVLILGGGATACSALGALRKTGARRIVAAVRSRSRAQTLLAVAGRLGLAVELTGFGPELAQTAWQLIISTVPAAGSAPVVSLIEARAIAADAIFDVIYDPWPTPLAAAAVTASMPVIAGYELLVQQAVGQFELMTGQPAPIEAMRAAGLAELDQRQAGTSRNIR